MKTLLKNCRLTNGMHNILIEDDKIIFIQKIAMSRKLFKKKRRLESESDEIIDIAGNLIIPGVIDPHVHVRDLEQADKEDWLSASKAALAGGITTIFDMPNTLPSTTNLVNLNLKRKAAEKSLINYKFYLGATQNNINEIEEILKTDPSDIAGIKVFLAASSSNEVIKDRETLKSIFKVARDFDKILVVHTELQELLDIWHKRLHYKSILKHNALRNRQCAIRGTKLVLDLAYEVRNKLYIAHISTAEEIDLIRAYKDSADIFCEVTPHHLLLNESVLNEAGNNGKVNPPLRSEKDNEALREAVIDGTIDIIGSDHAPHKLSEKEQEYLKAPSGFPGLETGLHLLLNEVNKGNLTIGKLVELTSRNPAEIFNLENRGEIKVGNFADLTVIDMNMKWKINASRFISKAKYSPFDGMGIQGKVIMTFVNGK